MCLVYLGSCCSLSLICCLLGRGGSVRVVRGDFGTLPRYVSCGAYGGNGISAVLSEWTTWSSLSSVTGL